MANRTLRRSQEHQLQPWEPTITAPFVATGRYSLAVDDSRHTLAGPDGQPFFSLGVNHAEETNLKYPHNRTIWASRYGSRDRWITDGVVRDLRGWGFNTIGWTADWICGEKPADDIGDLFAPQDELRPWGIPFNHGHSGGWAARDYRVADMPYCVQLRAAEIEGWNGNPTYPDVFSEEFDEYCAFLARLICSEHAENPNLVGYYLTDIPSWTRHASGLDFPGLHDLDAVRREQRLYDIAHRYYETIHRHVRAWDPDHLLLGDRYNGNAGIPASVLEAMKPFVDVLSVQYFPTASQVARARMRSDLDRWQAATGKPVIIADIGNWCPTTMNPDRTGDIADQGARGQDYIDTFTSVADAAWLVGWHWCALAENQARGWGLKDPWDEPYTDFVAAVTAFNERFLADHRRLWSTEIAR